MMMNDYTGATIFDKAGQKLKNFQGADSHFQNFIDAVRSRKTSDLKAEVLEGHLSSALCHTGNISYRLGKPLPPSECRNATRSNKDLSEALGRMEEHLGANGVDLLKTPLTLGPLLTMDPETERFTNNPAANEMLSRNYRTPFAVPAKV